MQQRRQARRVAQTNSALLKFTFLVCFRVFRRVGVVVVFFVCARSFFYLLFYDVCVIAWPKGVLGAKPIVRRWPLQTTSTLKKKRNKNLN